MASDGPARRSTLREIADAAGVAVSTASRTLTRSRQGLPPTSAAAVRVLAAARQANYQPDLHAAHGFGVGNPQIAQAVPGPYDPHNDDLIKYLLRSTMLAKYYGVHAYGAFARASRSDG